MAISDGFTRGDTQAFKKAVAAVERHRRNVRGAIFVALATRLALEFDFVNLLRDADELTKRIPDIGLTVLAYLVVIMWMGRHAGDRLGFGMGLGLGVVEAAYLGIAASLEPEFSLEADWRLLTVAAAHLPMAIFALRSASAYPPQDSKGPWIVGFIVALVFLSIGWVAPSLTEAIAR